MCMWQAQSRQPACGMLKANYAHVAGMLKASCAYMADSCYCWYHVANVALLELHLDKVNLFLFVILVVTHVHFDSFLHLRRLHLNHVELQFLMLSSWKTV